MDFFEIGLGRANLIILSIVSFLLFIPFIAMQFTNEVDWKLGDFVIAGVLLYAFILGLFLLWTKVKSKRLRLLACLSIVVLFLLIWTELAIGIFGTPFAGS